MKKKKQRNSSNVLRRICLRLLAVLLIIGIPTILVVSSFYIKNVTISGSQRYTSEEITGEIIKSKPDSNALYLYLKYKYFTNTTIPFVEKVDVDLVDNHSVHINVYEKMVTGCVKLLGEYLYFDKDGIIVESSSKRLEDIPLIKGLQYDKIILNEKLEVQQNESNEKLVDQKETNEKSEDQKESNEKFEEQNNKLNEKNEVQNKELFDLILNLTQLIEKYELDVDVILFSSNYEVTLDCGDIKVLIGKKSTYDESLSNLKNILEAAKGKKMEIDMKNTEDIFAKPEE